MRLLTLGYATMMALLIGSGAITAQTNPPGQTYPSLEKLPNFSGWWHIKVDPAKPIPIVEFLRQPPPLRPELAAAFRANLIEMQKGQAPRDYCSPTLFVGYKNGLGYPDDSIEFLFTPGRVTLTNLHDLVRRIPTDGRSLPSDPDEYNAGTSVGRWEGATLVVETVGLRNDAPFPFAFRGAPLLGANAHVVERIVLRDQNTLQIDAVITAPNLFVEPLKVTTQYTRATTFVNGDLGYCAKNDRSIDSNTGTIGLDLTPPPDLPPPPKAKR